MVGTEVEEMAGVAMVMETVVVAETGVAEKEGVRPKRAGWEFRV